MRLAATKTFPPTVIAALWAFSASGFAAFPFTAFGQEAIPTAAGAPGDGAPPTLESDPLRLNNWFDYGPGILRPVGPCGAPVRKADGAPDKSPHGQVWAGVGTQGYREIGGAVCAPIGDSGAVSVAVDAGQINGWDHHH
jgi:hypothetical protein